MASSDVGAEALERGGDPADGPSVRGFEIELLDTFLIFLRILPLYPPTHIRVETTVRRLNELLQAAQRGGVDLELEVLRNGLRYQGAPLDMRGAGRKELRDGLAGTAVSSLAVWSDVSKASLVEFALRLHRNTHQTDKRPATFQDLWGEPIEGIWIGEQVYAEPEADGPEGLGEGGDGEAPAGDGGGAGGGGGAKSVAVLGQLRRLALDCPRTRSLLQRLSVLLKDQYGESPSWERTDLLEHVLKLLPAEMRRFPLQGLRALQRVLEKFMTAVAEAPPEGGAPELDALLVHAVSHLFPSASRTWLPAKSGDEPQEPLSPEDERREGERGMAEDPELVRRHVEAGRADPPTTLPPDTGATELGWILVDTLSVVPADRRDAIRARLVAHMKSEHDLVASDEITTRLKSELAKPEPVRDAAAMKELASLVGDAGLDAVAASCGALQPRIVAATFPHLVGAYVRAMHGRLGPICRLVGREAVLEACPALLAPDGALGGEQLEYVLSERTADVLPLIEGMLLHGTPEIARRAGAALKSMESSFPAATVLRAAPPGWIPKELMCGLCEDGFAGKDSHRWDRQALEVLTALIEEPPADVGQEALPYATAALGYFPPALVETLLKRICERRRGLFYAYSAQVRRLAESILERFALAERRRKGAGRGGL